MNKNKLIIIKINVLLFISQSFLVAYEDKTQSCYSLNLFALLQQLSFDAIENASGKFLEIVLVADRNILVFCHSYYIL